VDKLHIEGVLTREEFFQLHVYTWMRNRLVQFFFVVGIIFLITAIFKIATNSPDRYSNELAYAAGLLIIGPMGMYYRLLKTYNSSRNTSDSARYEIDEESIKYFSNVSNYDMRWEGLYKIERIKRWIILYENNVTTRVIPTNRLSDAEFYQLVHFIRSNSRIWRTITKL
jgi:hypothetical protein